MIETQDRTPDVGALQDELAGLPDALRQAEGELAVAEARRDRDQQVYDAALVDVAAAQGRGAHAPASSWTPRSSADLARDSEAQRDAESVRIEADAALGRSLVAFNQAAAHVAALRMRERMLREALAQAERAQARHVEPAARRGDLLATIRRRLFGDGPEAA